jgi:hypothetical protein
LENQSAKAVGLTNVGVAACQVDQPNPTRRDAIKGNTTRMLDMAEMAVVGYDPFMPTKLVVFPEFAHLRSEVYPLYDRGFFPPGHLTTSDDCTVEMNDAAIDQSKSRVRRDGN